MAKKYSTLLSGRKSIQNEMINDKLSGSTRMIGMPHQLLAHNDPRLGVGSDLGRVYAETFLLEAPTICIKPGVVRFLPGKGSDERDAYLTAITQEGSGRSVGLIQGVLDDEDSDNLQYYDHEGKFGSYMKAVNMLAHTMAELLGIADIEVPFDTGGRSITLGNYDWSNYRLSSQYGYRKQNNYGSLRSGLSDESGWLETLAGSATNWLEEDDNYVQFYVDASASFSESVSNSTGSSMLESFVGQAESLAKEMSFILGTAGGSEEAQAILNEATNAMDESVTTWASQQDGGISGWLGTLGSRLTSGMKQVIKGGNFIIPEIWQDSAYDKSYGFTVTLATPYGGKLPWFLNVGIGMCFLLALGIPLQTSANTYRSPLILKAFSPGWWNCSLGIMDSMSIEKGGDGAWSIYGLPNEVKISVSIKDLYTTLSLPSNARDFVTNNGMMEFLMVNCGIDLTNQAISTKYKVWLNLLSNSLSNYVKTTANNWMQGIQDSVREKLIWF